MSNILDYFIRFGTNAQGALGQINSSLNRTNSQIAQTTQNVTGLGRAFMFNQAQEAFANFGTLMDSLNGPAIKLEASLAGVKAITGLAGKELDLVETSARNMATTFGVSATDSVQAYSDVLSRLGPHLAKQPKELEAMGKNIAVLSKQMGGDMVGAMDALTTSMLQYNVDTTNAAGATKAMGIIMDQISAGTKLGSANVTQVSAALKITGNEAYNAGIAMSETQAAIQVLGQTGLYGAEAGTKFRNVLAKLGEGRFLPKETQDNLRAAGVDIVKLQDKTLTLAQRMQELQKVKGDGALLTQMFGENKGAAMALLQNDNLLTSWTKQIATSQGEAAKQTEEHTKTTSSLVSIAKAHWNDLLITMGDYTKSFAPMAAVLMPASQMIVSFGMLMDTWVGGQLKKAVTWLWTSSVSFASWAATVATTGLTAMGTWVSSVITATAAQLGFNVAISANPIGIAIAAIAALGLAVYGVVKNWDAIKNFFSSIPGYIMSFYNASVNFFKNLVNTLKNVLVTIAKVLWEWHPVRLLYVGISKFAPAFLGFMNSLVFKIKTSFFNFLNYFKDLFQNIKSASIIIISSLVFSVTSKVKKMFEFLIAPVRTFIDTSMGYFGAFYGFITSVVFSVKEYFSGIFTTISDKISYYASFIGGLFGFINSLAYKSILNIVNFAKTYFPNTFAVFKTFIEYNKMAFEGIKNTFVSVFNFMSNIFTNVIGYISTISDKIKSVLGYTKEETKQITAEETKTRMAGWQKLGYMPNMETIMQNKPTTFKQDISGNKEMAKTPVVSNTPKPTNTNKIGQTPKTKKSNEAIVTGGSKSTNVYITLDKLVETINNYNSNLGDLKKRIEDEVLDSLSRVLIMGQRQAE